MPALDRRYLFTGELVLRTPLHIGGGEALLTTSKSPVVRRPDGLPFIPGSSFKGAFRSTVEKLAATLGLPSCGLDPGYNCVGAPGEAQRQFNQRRRAETWDDRKLLEELEAHQCETCWLFGSPYTAGRVLFSDLDLTTQQAEVIQRRDGVAINRDSETKVNGALYDYEVVPPSLSFRFELRLDNPQGRDLGYISLGLSEFVAGFGRLGGKRSSGLGSCHLDNLQIYFLDLLDLDARTRAARLRAYLLANSWESKLTSITDVDSFLQAQIDVLMPEGGANAQASRQ